MENRVSGRRTAFAPRAVGVLALCLGGCAINPMVPWTPPPEPVRPADAPLDSMEGARDYASAYKLALHAKAREYVQQQGQLNDALLGLGLLTTGALASTAHKDVPLALGFLFGGTYLYGQQNLGKPRLDVYQTGIGATNCALAAVAPLNFSMSELAAIQVSSQALAATELPKLGEVLSKARQMYAIRIGPNGTRMPDVDDQLRSAGDTYSAGLQLLHDSSQLPGRVSAAAAGLKRTVDTVAAQVDRLASNTIVDPASVSKSLGGLAAIVGSVAPGAELDKAFLAKVNGRAGGSLGSASIAEFSTRNPSALPPRDNLVDVLTDLGRAQAVVDAKVKYLGGRIASSKEFGNGAAEALRVCEVKVSDTILALKVEPATVTITKPTGDPVTAEIYVSGGAKNYAGRLTQTAAGVELIPPRAGEGTFVVKVTKDAKEGELNVRVEDSSNPPQAKMVKVTIQAK
jgi:hypothetical protein